VIEKIILMSIISARIEKIYDEMLERNVRPTLNVFFRKPFGYGFTTIMTELERQGYVNYISEFTAPGLVGTIRAGKIVQGSLANSGYKVTAIDEVRLLDSKAKKAILELTELGRATRVIQGMVENRIEKQISGGKIIAEAGKLTVYVHTAFVFGTASKEIMQDPDVNMILSRCFCVNLAMSAEEAVMLKKKGRKISVSNSSIPEEPVYEVKLPEDVNEYLLSNLTDNAVVSPEDGGYFTRAHDDLIRISAIRAVARKRDVIDKKDAKFALSLYRLHQIGYLGATLNDSALKVYEFANGVTIDELAAKCGMSKSWTYKMVRRLIDAGLVAKINNRYFKVGVSDVLES